MVCAKLGGGLGACPPGNFLKIDAKRLNLVAFQSIKTTFFLGKLKTSCMDDIWKNISTVTVIILSTQKQPSYEKMVRP